MYQLRKIIGDLPAGVAGDLQVENDIETSLLPEGKVVSFTCTLELPSVFLFAQVMKWY
jgi:hypothetical protein